MNASDEYEQYLDLHDLFLTKLSDRNSYLNDQEINVKYKHEIPQDLVIMQTEIEDGVIRLHGIPSHLLNQQIQLGNLIAGIVQNGKEVETLKRLYKWTKLVPTIYLEIDDTKENRDLLEKRDLLNLKTRYQKVNTLFHTISSTFVLRRRTSDPEHIMLTFDTKHMTVYDYDVAYSWNITYQGGYAEILSSKVEHTIEKFNKKKNDEDEE